MVPSKARRLPGGRSVVPSLAAVAMGTLLVLAPVPAAAAPGARLMNARVAPTSGTTATTFAFSVEFNGTAGVTATAVVARVAGATLPLALAAGSARRGTWTGSSRLPVGTWQVVFEADPSDGPAIQLTLLTPVIVSRPAPAPTPTTVPTPGLTPGPGQPSTAGTTPAAAAAPGGLAASPTPFGTIIDDPSGLASSSHGGLATPASPTGAGGVKPASVVRLSAEGVALIGLLAAVVLAAAAAERRRRSRAAAAENEELQGDGALGDGAATRPLARGPGDDSAVEDEPIGSIEYSPPPDPPP